MSKVAFRARNLDGNRSLQILREHELPPEFIENGASTAPRITQQEITTGMEKEEETEHHLQQALNAQQINKTSDQTAIPIPEITEVEEEEHRKVYQRPFKLPKSLINYQAFMLESDKPLYDADEEDAAWMIDSEQGVGQRLNVTAYERMMQRLEDGSSSQRLVTLSEARLLLKEDADEALAEAVYQHWCRKREQTDSLLPTVLTERRDGSNSNNPYVAFRRRKEKMQTRKNRKNDELSYERMLKLTLDLRKASLLLELIKRREEAKRELCILMGSVFERRYAATDFTGSLQRDAELTATRQRTFDERLHTQAIRVADFLKFAAVARSPTASAALQSHVERASSDAPFRSSRRRRFEPPSRTDDSAMRKRGRREPLTDEESLPRLGEFDRLDDVIGRKRRRVARFPPKDPPVSPLAPVLPPAERAALLASHLPVRYEDSQAAAAVDREFAFRRKLGCRYAAPHQLHVVPSKHAFAPVCVPNARGGWRLCFARRRVARTRRPVLDLGQPLAAVSPSAARFQPRVENGCATSTLVSVNALVHDAEQAVCASCDLHTLQCAAERTLCGEHGSLRPHASDVHSLRQLRAAHTSVFVPRTTQHNLLPVDDDVDVEVDSSHAQHSPPSALLDVVGLYLGRLAKQSGSQRSLPAGQSDRVESVRDAHADNDCTPGKRPLVNDVNKLAAANGCVVKTNGVGTSAGRERCEALPLVNGNNNNDASQSSAAPTRLASIGKRITNSLSGLLNGIAAIPMGAENGKSASQSLAGGSQGSSSTTPTRLLLGSSGSKQSALSSQSSTVDSESDADALINEQVRTPTIST